MWFYFADFICIDDILNEINFNFFTLFLLILFFRNVTFHYGNDTSKGELLRNVNIKILSGQNVAIVGPSGSGKSTTLRLISRMLDPNSGQVRECVCESVYEGENLQLVVSFLFFSFHFHYFLGTFYYFHLFYYFIFCFRYSWMEWIQEVCLWNLLGPGSP